MRSRLAPTPSGFLHAGNAFNFLLTAELARRAEGELLLRIDDMDRSRYRPAYAADVFVVLRRLGIKTDLGPRSVVELESQWSQSHRLSLYEQNLQKLVATGRVYACNRSRKQIAAASINGKYLGHHRDPDLPLNTPGVSWRIDTRRHASDPDFSTDLPHPADTLGDFVVRTKSGQPAYQLCSLTDDIHFGIDHVVRGEDLRASSGAQLWLAALLGADGWRTALKLHHHPLRMAPDGQKLSKSAGAAAISNAPPDRGDLLIENIRRAVLDYLATQPTNEFWKSQG